MMVGVRVYRRASSLFPLFFVLLDDAGAVIQLSFRNSYTAVVHIAHGDDSLCCLPASSLSNDLVDRTYVSPLGM